MHEYPKLISDLMANNKLKLETILSCNLPWLRLKIAVPHFSNEVIQQAAKESSDWRNTWGDIESNYQVKQWNGSLLFGPTDFAKFRQDMRQQSKYVYDDDEDHTCMLERKNYEFGWNISETHPIRKFVTSIFPNDDDINIVNYYTLPPGGFVFPHRDRTSGKQQLNKIYIPLKWAQGNEFGVYNWGNIPIEERNVYLLNNYSYTHWVVNNSNEDRVVLTIGSNLHAIKDIILDSFLNAQK